MHPRTTRQLIQRKVAELLKQAQELQALLTSTNGESLSPGLATKQQQVFHAIAKIDGRDAHTRQQIQKQLSRIEGDPITEPLVVALKTFLKRRQLGIRCVCGEPAAPLWQSNAACAEGGYMTFSHTGTSGRSEAHGGATKVPKLTLVERIDRRRTTLRQR